MTKGKIKWYNKKRGFGLIVSNDKEFFFHHSQIQGSKNLEIMMMYILKKVLIKMKKCVLIM